ncbi:hypothetical protein H8F21_14515 [Pseudomonas sp. P66]|uniref:Conjugal transfer protein TraG n=1 Tax=Pseudomonas arcuscaelestis TaxID=2710591 RepID=A0ABS2BYT5_9PSED|nr:hypothetical protein [Pseudomonas arcuscaelestis]MBM5458778.1 hypothetical protein [Pseudomonas arcuscaelestis]
MATESDVPNYDYLQIVNSNFGELVSHYINMWQAYNQSFTQAAMNLCLWGGLAWVSLLTMKAPVDRLKTAASAAGVVLLVAMLLQPGNYNIGPAGGSVGLSAGAGWSVQLIGNIYQLFKSALDSVNRETAMELAFENAYHVTDEGTLRKFNDSPVREMYEDYITQCQSALASTAGTEPDTRALGKFVGLFGSTGINQIEVNQITKDSYEAIKAGGPANSKALSMYVGGNIWNGYQMLKKDYEVAGNVDKARTMLGRIPEDANPFRDGTKSYLMPSEEYWVRQYFPDKKNEGRLEFEKATENDNNKMYRNPTLTDTSPITPEQEVRFYPKDCLQMYGMVHKAVANWTNAVSREIPTAKRSAFMRDGIHAQELMIKNIENLAEQRKLDKENPSAIPLFGSETRSGQAFNWGVDDTAKSLMTKIQDIGMWFKQWMLTFKIPTMINGCAMLAGILVVLFPVICVFAVFVNPSILISYVKILAFSFMIPLINNLCLTMAATLLAMNSELMTGLTAGNFSENYPLLISASSAQYIIFMALTAVEIIIAKMLIWDDVKGLSGFNPGGAATGMAATGGAVVGTAIKIGSKALSMLRGPAKLVGAAGKAANAAKGVGGGGGGGLGGPYSTGGMNVRFTPPAPSKSSYSAAGSQLSRSPTPTKPAQPSGPSGPTTPPAPTPGTPKP